MAEIFTRAAVEGIMADEGLSPRQRAERLMALHGRALEDGFVPRDEVERERERWQQAQDPTQSDAYRALAGEYEAYRAMQGARGSAEYAAVKPKFFETVYGMVERGEGTRSVGEQLADIRERFEEFFVSGGAPEGRGAPTVVLPTGNPPVPARRMTLTEAMRRANRGERVEMGMIGNEE